MTEAMEAIREVCEGITKQVDRAYMAECGKKREAPHKLWKVMADSGLLAIGVPEEYGGAGGELSEVTYALDLLGRSGLLATRYVTSQMARTTIARHGSEEQKKLYLPRAATGDLFFAFAVTEAEAGTNSFKMRTRAERQPNGDYVLNGEKAFITGIHEADYVLIVARTAKLDPAERKSGISIFILDPKSKGVGLSVMDIALHMADKSFIVNLDNVVVPAKNMVGIEGKGLESLFDCLNPERLMAAGLQVGLADFVLNKGATYAKERAPFDKPIGIYQSVQHPMAAAKARIEAARALTYLATAKYDRGENAGMESNMVKYLSAEALKDAADIAVSTFGGAAMDLSQDVLPFYLWAKFSEIAPINKNVVLSSIAERSLGLPRSY